MQHKESSSRPAGRCLITITQLCCATTLTIFSFYSHADIRGHVVRILDGDTIEGVRLENGNFPTLSVLSLTGDFVPLSANP